MESYLFNGEGKPLTNGKKEPYEELVRKCAGTPDFFLSSIFSCQARTGNFLSLERSERKELFIRELLGLGRLRLIAAEAKDIGDEVARTTLGLDGQARSLKELVEAGVEEPRKLRPGFARCHPVLRPWRPRSVQHNNGCLSSRQWRPVGSHSWVRLRL